VTKLASRIFQVRPGELKLILVLGFILLINSMSLELSDVVAVSGFLEQVDVSNILIVWIIDLILVGIAASAQSLIVDRFNRMRVLQGMIVVFILAYTILRLMFVIQVIPAVVNYSLLFLLMEQQWLFFPLIFWVLANDMFDLAQAQRLFPLITAFGFVGQIIGLGLASISPWILDTLNLAHWETLTFNVINYVVILVLVSVGLHSARLRERRANSEVPTVQQNLAEGFSFVREVKAFRYLMIALFAGAFILAISDYRFLSASDNAFQLAPPGSFQTFYGLFQLGVTLVAIVVQTLITGRLIKKLELKSIFIFLPIVMLICLGMMFIPILSLIVVGRAFYRVVQVSIEEPSRKALLSLVPDERRGRVSIFIESYLFVAGAILGSLVVGASVLIAPLIGLEFPHFIYLPLAVIAGIIALWATIQMRATYDKSMLDWRLRRRSRGASVLDKLEF
jgi:ATP:ADP antiporter, AAA family